MRRILLSLAALVALTLAARTGLAEERIRFFDSTARVMPDGQVQVTEVITVKAEGRQIKRGIYRYFPTAYRDKFLLRTETGFTVREVLRDGRPEPWLQKSHDAGVRVYMGQEGVTLKPGVYTYTLRYTTEKQVGFFPDYDELYWNVTGNAWELPIDRARFTLHPPPGGAVLQAAAYTGPSGEQGRDFLMSRDEEGHPVFVTTRPLEPGEGLTVAVGWTKGAIAEPSARQVIIDYLGFNRSAIIAAAGFVAVLIYYVLAWSQVGRDPKKGPIVPLFKPPDNLSPAACRHIRRMGFDHKAFTATVIDLAVKGALVIEGKGKPETLRRTSLAEPGNLDPQARAVFNRLFLGDDHVDLRPVNHATVSGAAAALKKSLKSDTLRLAFCTNGIWMAPGLLLTLLCVGGMVWSIPEQVDMLASGFMCFWLTAWTAGVVALMRQTGAAWRAGMGRGLFMTLFTLPFLLGEVIGLGILVLLLGPASGALFLGMALVNVLFAYLLKAPTVAGRKLMDSIEGFRLFLSVAEQPRLEALHPPDLTPELFEAFLPYAMALDVENQWGQRFDAWMRSAGRDPGSYRPGWAGDSAFTHLGGAGLSHGLGEGLSSAISSAMASAGSSPGSSSGSGGGGSSGGGGGGGGGGGW